MSKDQALRLALDALEWFTAAEQGDEPPINKTITAIKQALEQPEPPCKTGSQCTSKCDGCAESEPVAWMYESVCGNDFATRCEPPSYAKNIRPLYTIPPKREWQGLTDEEINACDPQEECWNLSEVAHAIEAKLKEKNT